jgi:hypothetical protein
MFNSVPIDFISGPRPAKLEAQHSLVEHLPHHNNNSSSEAHNEGIIDSQKLEHLIRAEKEDRVKILLKYLKRFGVPEKYLFDIDDLIEMKNMPKVTRCMAMLAKMVRRYI